MQAAKPRIPLSLVTGFLGSGKTTLLTQVARRYHDRRLVYLINEFAPADVDGRILDVDRDTLVTVAGGSIFCQCKVTEFMGRLKQIHERSSVSTEPIEGVVIEASGIADPKVFGQLLEETRFDQIFQLCLVLAVVDPGTFGKLRHTLPNITAQIEAADRVLINKTDLFSPAAITETRNELRAINPAIVVTETQYGRFDFDIFTPALPRHLIGQYAGCADPNYAVMELAYTRPMDIERLRSELSALQNNIYRIKGFVPATKGYAYIDATPSGVNVRTMPKIQIEPVLVFIVPPEHTPTAATLRTRIARGDFDL
ncbi:MAG: GTP-binding protein [Phycisphaerales bacterium]|nr:GTP-binding protein [Phycisphaerales bacterium]